MTDTLAVMANFAVFSVIFRHIMCYLSHFLNLIFIFISSNGKHGWCSLLIFKFPHDFSFSFYEFSTLKIGKSTCFLELVRETFHAGASLGFTTLQFDWWKDGTPCRMKS